MTKEEPFSATFTMLSPYRFLLIVSTVDSPPGLATDSRTVQKFRLKVPWQDAMGVRQGQRTAQGLRRLLAVE